MNKRKGFTLIELIVVMIIIAILVSLALPQFTKYIAKGKYTAFASDMNQLSNIAMIINQDLQDPNTSLTCGAYGSDKNSTVAVSDLDANLQKALDKEYGDGDGTLSQTEFDALGIKKIDQNTFASYLKGKVKNVDLTKVLVMTGGTVNGKTVDGVTIYNDASIKYDGKIWFNADLSVTQQ